MWLCMSRLGIISLGYLVSQVIGFLMSWTTDLLLFRVVIPCVIYKIKEWSTVNVTIYNKTTYTIVVLMVLYSLILLIYIETTDWHPVENCSNGPRSSSCLLLPKTLITSEFITLLPLSTFVWTEWIDSWRVIRT